MKKILLVVIIGLLLCTAAFADHAESLGLGAISGVGFGWAGQVVPDFYPVSLSLKIPKVPLFWALNMRLNEYYFGLGVTGDYYFWEPNLVSTIATNDNGSYNLKIDWYVGAGFYANMYMGPHDYFGGDGGLRIPFGVSWHAMQQIKQLEVSVGSVVGLGIRGDNNKKDPSFHWFLIPVEIAVRWWFD